MSNAIKMLDIILQVIVVGMGTAAICRTIAYYDGPFSIFPRLKEFLLPTAPDQPDRKKEIETLDLEDIESLMALFSTALSKTQEIDSKLEVWREFQTKLNPKFYQGLRGTLYLLLDCPFCLGPYVSVLLAIVSTIHVLGYVPSPEQVLETTVLTNLILTSAGGFGLHFLISKHWANGDGDV